MIILVSLFVPVTAIILQSSKITSSNVKLALVQISIHHVVVAAVQKST